MATNSDITGFLSIQRFLQSFLSSTVAKSSESFCWYNNNIDKRQLFKYQKFILEQNQKHFPERISTFL